MTDVTLDYLPTYGGQPADLAATGGSVTRLRLYPTAQRTGTPVVDAGPAAPVAGGRYRFTFERPADGTYYVAVEWVDQPGGQAVVDADDVLTIPLPSPPEPVEPGMVVAADVVARAAGFRTPLSPQARTLVLDAITAAQADVEAYLNRPLAPEIHVEVLRPLGDPQQIATYVPPIGRPLARVFNPEHYYLGHPLRSDDVLSLISAVPYGGSAGLFTVTYLAGLDGKAHPPIVRYVTAHAAAIARAHPSAQAVGGSDRRVTSKTLQGQSVTYDKESAEGAATTPGFLPTIEGTLRRYRRSGQAAFQRPSGWDHPR